jgi:putative ABC transport system ATP-binding protein
LRLTVTDSPHAPAAHTTETVVQVAGLEVIYQRGTQQVHALRGVNLTVPRGQFVCVRGRSGSGKSTLLHVLGALWPPTRGSVRVAGIDLGALDPKQAALYRRRHCGIVFQFFNLLPGLTVAQNVAFPLVLDGVARGRIEAIVGPLLEELGIAERRNHNPSELSGGEMQRAAIARAMAIDPRLILADEPTGNLDTVAGAQIWALLRDLSHRKRVTIVMVTHDPDATAFADRVVVLEDGRVLQDSVAG